VDRGRSGGLLIALSALALALAPAAASAKTTLGPDPLPVPNGSATFGSCCVATYVITQHPGATLAAPTAGVVTRWRVHEPLNQSGVMKPRVLRAAGGASYTGVATGAEVPVGTSHTVKTYATRLPIGAGELFGVDANTGPTVAVTGAAFRLGFPAIADGATASLTGAPNNFALAVNADVEPDADGDGFGDETQDLGPATATAPDTELGRIASTSTVTLTNRDGAPATIASLRLGGAAVDDFLVARDDCAGVTLQPGESCAIGIRFAPSAAGSRAATLSVRSAPDGLGQVLTGADVALAGTGVAPVAPQSSAQPPDLVAILLSDALSVRRGKALRATVFSTVAGRATVRILRRSSTVAGFEADVRKGKTSLRLPTRRLRAGRYRVAVDVTAAGQTSSDTVRLVVRRLAG
jgi:hypothetical protein